MLNDSNINATRGNDSASRVEILPAKHGLRADILPNELDLFTQCCIV